MGFKNKVVIVTGASSGIGAATAVAFSAEGADVVMVARNEKKMAEVAKKCKSPFIIRADLANDGDVEKVISETVKKFGRIDVLVNNAGTAQGASGLADVNIEAYDSIMSVNLRAVVYLTGLAVPYLVKTKGNVINISSVAGKMIPSSPIFIFYCTSKAGLDHFTKCAAAELSPQGVRVNAVSPGPVVTDFYENNDLHLECENLKTLTALNRVSKAKEIADLVLFLASDKAEAITGSDFVSDNGTLVNRV